MKIIGSFLIILFVALQASAKTVVVSDIDDTIKISHVLNRSEAIKNAFKTGNVFRDTYTVYQGLVSYDPDLRFYYVTNALRWMMAESHRNFLVQNNFPNGYLSLRESMWDDEFKINEIRNIIKREKPDLMILLGDNGERDPEIYAQLAKEHSDVRFLTYIHVDYFSQSPGERGALVLPGQISYVTSWDLLLQLRQENLVGDEFTRSFIRGFAKSFLPESGHEKIGNLVIPAWIDCRDFIWTADDSDFVGSQDHRLVKERTLNRCSHEAIAD